MPHPFPVTPPAPPVTVTTRPGPAGGPTLEQLIVVGRRQNPKRQVLFVSPILGKHLPVAPATALAGGMALAERVLAVLGADPSSGDGAEPGPSGRVLARALATGVAPATAEVAPATDTPVEAIVIGFAETATALGHAVRRRLGPGPLVHTTRRGVGTPLVTCSESHSHAVDHAVHHHDPDLFTGAAAEATVVIVDDELTTGRTALDLIAAIQARWPRPRYVIASLVDWRTEEHRGHAAAVAEQLGTTISSVALADAEAEVGEAPPLPYWAPLPVPATGPAVTRWDLEVGPPTARHGWSVAHQAGIDERLAAAMAPLAAARAGDRAVVLGTEELMYVPVVAGLHLGPGVTTRSTTRSPIIPSDAPGYPIVDRAEFPALAGEDGVRFLYGLTADPPADDAYVFVDGDVVADDHPMLAQLGRLARHLHLVVLR